jgi:hypothetical protein
MELLGVGADGQAADGHGEPPYVARGPLSPGKGGSAIASEHV